MANARGPARAMHSVTATLDGVCTYIIGLLLCGHAVPFCIDLVIVDKPTVDLQCASVLGRLFLAAFV